METFENAVSLPCGHSACAASWDGVRARAKSAACPICRKPASAAPAPPNWALRKAVECALGRAPGAAEQAQKRKAARAPPCSAVTVMKRARYVCAKCERRADREFGAKVGSEWFHEGCLDEGARARVDFILNRARSSTSLR